MMRDKLHERWIKTLSILDNAAVYCDSASKSALQWNIGSHATQKRNAMIYEFPPSFIVPDSKIVVLLSSHLSLYSETLKKMSMSGTNEFHIITTISQESHMLELDHDPNLIGKFTEDDDDLAFGLQYLTDSG